MPFLDLIATSAFGIESIVAQEIRKLGIENAVTENGRVSFKGDYDTIIRTNLWLRCADRVLVKLAEFKAMDFEELFQGVKSVRWEDFIPVNAFIHVTGKCANSTLMSVSDCQAITKKAIIESMKRKHALDWFDENGPAYKIEISLLNDIATLTLDTSGDGLHKRGYRLQRGEAPLRETIAAALVYISRWRTGRVLADPLCGSGTIPIEAALIARNIAPGMNRVFASENWPEITPATWTRYRDECISSIDNTRPEILASDMDREVFKAAVANAEKAGVSDSILFQKKPVSEFSTKASHGCVICNPPYGERMKKSDVDALYREMGEVFGRLDSWSYFILTSHEQFEKSFGKKADKNRKLYNGKIKTYLYQYLGPLPPRERRESRS